MNIMFLTVMYGLEFRCQNALTFIIVPLVSFVLSEIHAGPGPSLINDYIMSLKV